MAGGETKSGHGIDYYKSLAQAWYDGQGQTLNHHLQHLYGYHELRLGTPLEITPFKTESSATIA
jgi:hypothetical protein